MPRPEDKPYTRVFLSWSGRKSHDLAVALRDWLPKVLPFVTPWMSQIDLRAGFEWRGAILEEASRCDAGIICLTADNLSAPWVHFEAGRIPPGRPVCPYLLNIKPDALQGGPLAGLQAQSANYSGTLRVLESINGKAPDAIRLTDVRPLFDEHWPELQTAIADATKAGGLWDAFLTGLPHEASAARPKRIPVILSPKEKGHAFVSAAPTGTIGHTVKVSSNEVRGFLRIQARLPPGILEFSLPGELHDTGTRRIIIGSPHANATSKSVIQEAGGNFPYRFMSYYRITSDCLQALEKQGIDHSVLAELYKKQLIRADEDNPFQHLKRTRTFSGRGRILETIKREASKGPKYILGPDMERHEPVYENPEELDGVTQDFGVVAKITTATEQNLLFGGNTGLGTDAAIHAAEQPGFEETIHKIAGSRDFAVLIKGHVEAPQNRGKYVDHGNVYYRETGAKEWHLGDGS